ncbi:hypothetical protein [Inconstantimicrobium mannanitabidum]|uniref:Uncharacterized protein n=1 Tax=Inconstantimicrobium mannanitabidum TaxID=1604901 RepID=A0ACB5RFD8_9CLOT|nr:hypothetical protein [Clostridium sp. TW13]GKX67696.1 hypothetical protein rsdtw13_29540 [Clostridium sp. TW13]
MHGQLIIGINIVLLIISILIYLKIRKENKLSMFDYRGFIKLLVIIAPCIIVIINIIIYYIFKPSIFWSKVIFSPLIIPFYVFIKDLIKYLKREIIYKIYYFDIENDITKWLDGYTNIYNNVNIVLYNDKKLLCCKVILRLKYPNTNVDKTTLLKHLESNYNNIRFNIVIHSMKQ